MSRLLAAFSLALAVLFGGLPAAAQSIGYSPNTLPLSGSCGVVTVSTPCLNLTQTWNNVATTFTGLKLNVTDTASASGSLLLDLQVGGASKFSVTKTGEVTAVSRFVAPFYYVNSNTGAIFFGASLDTVIQRDGAANTLAQRNGTAAQAFNVYNTYTDASNYERGYSRWNAGVFEFGMETAGTGTTKHTRINRASGANLYLGDWFNNSSGHFLASVDNTYDIGASGANRPRNVYVAGTILAGSSITGANMIAFDAGSIGWNSRIRMFSAVDGALRITNNAGTITTDITLTGASWSGGSTANFGGTIIASNSLIANNGSVVANAAGYLGQGTRSRIYSPVDGNHLLTNDGLTGYGLLQFGGTTSSFPAWKRSGAFLEARLADDSAFTGIQASQINFANASRIFDIGDGVFRLSNSAVTLTTDITLSGASGTGTSTATFGGSIVSGGNVQAVSAGGFSWLGGKGGITQVTDGAFTFSNNAGSNSVSLTVGASNLLTLNGGLKTTGATFALQTATTLTDNAAAQVATMTNGPTAGNPTKWIAINDNGTTRYIPAW